MSVLLEELHEGPPNFGASHVAVSVSWKSRLLAAHAVPSMEVSRWLPAAGAQTESGISERKNWLEACAAESES